jgi:hypothetical protein
LTKQALNVCPWLAPSSPKGILIPLIPSSSAIHLDVRTRTWPSVAALMMRTSWSCGHAIHNQDWDLILESWNRYDRSVTQ